MGQGCRVTRSTATPGSARSCSCLVRKDRRSSGRAPWTCSACRSSSAIRRPRSCVAPPRRERLAVSVAPPRGLVGNRVATAGVAAGSVLLLALLVLPIIVLLRRGGVDGITQLGADPEL